MEHPKDHDMNTQTNEQNPGTGPEPTEDPPEGPQEVDLEQELAQTKDQLLRTAADFDNFRKRSRRDVDEAKARGEERVLREVLPVMDNLERAMNATSATKTDSPDLQAVTQGVAMVLKQFEECLEKLGVERIPVQGERFDPAMHDAIQQIETAEHGPGEIVNEILPGYRYAHKLLRPAMVAVAKAPQKPAERTGVGGSDNAQEL